MRCFILIVAGSAEDAERYIKEHNLDPRLTQYVATKEDLLEFDLDYTEFRLADGWATSEILSDENEHLTTQ
jgi:hypothetical protein